MVKSGWGEAGGEIRMGFSQMALGFVEDSLGGD